MVMLRYHLTGIVPGTGEVVYSGVVATWDLAEILMRGDEKYSLSVFWSLIPLHVQSLPPNSHTINKLR